MNVAVLGIGNELAADDGVGIHVVRQLRSRLRDPRVHCLESERGGMDILDHLEGCDRGFIVDASWSGLYPPGTIRRDLLRSTAPPHCPHSLHTISVDAVLSLGSLTGLRLPDEVILYTIEAVDIETFGARCSEGVQASLPDVVSRLMEEIISILPDALCIARPEEISQMVSSSSDKFTNVFE
jgi:hydrogenase maturation protease